MYDKLECWSVISLFDILTAVSLLFTEIMDIRDIHHSNDTSVSYYSFIFMLVFSVAFHYKNFPHRFEILLFSLLFAACPTHLGIHYFIIPIVLHLG
jgi:hypothetical protein